MTRARRVTGRWPRAFSLTAVAFALVVASAGPAAAHPALVSSVPGAGYAVTDAPRELTLTFNEPVALPDQALTLADDAGRRRPLRVSLDPGGLTLRGVPQSVLPVGAYDVRYRVIGQDGDLIQGTYRFGVAVPVGASLSSIGRQGDPERVQPWTTILRGLLFLGLAIALGGWYLAWRVHAATGGLPGVRPWVFAGSLLALTGVVGLVVDLGPVTELRQRLNEPGPALLLGAEALLLTLATLTARVRAVAIGCLLGVIALEALRAHPRQAGGALAAALVAVHLLAGAVWLGGLVHTVRLAVAWRGKRLAARVAVETYARNALVLFGVVAATGTASALSLLPTRADWTGTTYGRVLLVKLGLLMLVLLAASAARARLRRTRTSSESGGAAAPQPPLALAAKVEVALLAGVVVAAAAVTSVTPAKLVPVSSLLAAPIGPALRTAERVNQVSISLVASQGRVELRADAPDDGRPLNIDLDAEVRAPNVAASRLTLTTCGPTCWTAPVTWVNGSNTVRLDVDAGRWQAGRTAIPVVWPAVPAPGLLARVQAAMGARSAIDTVESVTSGFGVDIPSRSRRTGQGYLRTQPWSDGGATDAVVVTSEGQRTLIFALPALGYHFAMRLDAQDRVVSERIVTPNHLLTRQYKFPD